MYCRYCGNKIDEDSIYCQFCGKPLIKPQEKFENKYNRYTKITKTANSQKKSYSDPKLSHSSRKLTCNRIPLFQIILWCILGVSISMLIYLIFQNQYDNISAPILIICGILCFEIGTRIHNGYYKNVPFSRLKKLTGTETAGGTINGVGIMYFDTLIHISMPIEKLAISSGSIDLDLYRATIKYQFLTILAIPIVPIDCHLVYVPLGDLSPNCKIFALCKWNFKEIISIYFTYWGGILAIIGIALFFYNIS